MTSNLHEAIQKGEMNLGSFAAHATVYSEDIWPAVLVGSFRTKRFWSLSLDLMNWREFVLIFFTERAIAYSAKGLFGVKWRVFTNVANLSVAAVGQGYYEYRGLLFRFDGLATRPSRRPHRLRLDLGGCDVEIGAIAARLNRLLISGETRGCASPESDAVLRFLDAEPLREMGSDLLRLIEASRRQIRST